MFGNGKLFISHTHEDNQRCQPLLTALDAWQVDYWFDTQELDAGQRFSDRIQQALDQRDIFVRVCTAAALRSFWMDRELRATRGLRAAFPKHPRRIIHVILPGEDAEQHRALALPDEEVVDTTQATRAVWLHEFRTALGLAAERRVSRRTALALGATSLAAVATTALAAVYYSAPPPAVPDPFRPASAPRMATPDPGALRVRWQYMLDLEAPMVQSISLPSALVGLAADSTSVYSIFPHSVALWAQSVRDGTVQWLFEGDAAAGITGLYRPRIMQASGTQLFLLTEIDTQTVNDAALKLISVDKATGKMRWQSGAIGQSAAYSDLCVAGGAIYFQNDGKLYGYSQDGHPLWPPLTLYSTEGNSVQVPGSSDSYYATPAYANGLLYVSINGGSLVAVNAATGAVVWSKLVARPPSLGAQQFTPAVAGGLVYLGASDGYVHALDAATGALRWKTQLVQFGQTIIKPYAVMGAPLVSGGVVYIQSGLSQIGSDAQNGKLNALQAQSGKLLWQIDPATLSLPLHIADVTAIPNLQPAVFSGNSVYWTVTLVSTDTNQLGAQALLSLHPQDGSLQSYFLAPIDGLGGLPTSYIAPSAPVLVPGGIAMLSDEPTVYVLDV